MESFDLPIARYQFTFRVTQKIVLPEYSGSALRGVFGRALRKIACMTKQADCKNCPLYRTCPYTNIFETPAPQTHQLQKFSQVPNGYIIEPPEWGRRFYHTGETLTFNLVLFGKLINQLPLIAFAFKRALAFNLAGGKAELEDIAIFLPDMTACYSILENGNIIEYPHHIVMPMQFSTEMEIELITPLRIQENGNPLSENRINVTRFLKTLLKRISLLYEFHYHPLNLDFNYLTSMIENIDDEKWLFWQDWARYSSRQNQKMKLGGVMGKWHLKNVPQEWAILLYIGQWLHCGKNGTFGLGQYKITNL